MSQNIGHSVAIGATQDPCFQLRTASVLTFSLKAATMRLNSRRLYADTRGWRHGTSHYLTANWPFISRAHTFTRGTVLNCTEHAWHDTWLHACMCFKARAFALPSWTMDEWYLHIMSGDLPCTRTLILHKLHLDVYTCIISSMSY